MKIHQLRTPVLLALCCTLLLVACGGSEEVSEPLAEQALPTGSNVCFYEYSNYRGAQWCPSANSALLIKWNDRISSVMVRSGYQVELFRSHNFAGTSLKLSSNADNLASKSFDNVTSSFKISKTNTPPPPSNTDLQTLFQKVNEARSRGATCGNTVYPPASPLTLDARLSRAAQKHSEDMQAAGQMTHVTPSGAIHYKPGTTFDQRISQEGYIWSGAAENIAKGQQTAEQVMTSWMNSPGHCSNIMGNSKDIGLGKAGVYWTQVFATPAR